MPAELRWARSMANIIPQCVAIPAMRSACQTTRQGVTFKILTTAFSLRPAKTILDTVLTEAGSLPLTSKSREGSEVQALVGDWGSQSASRDSGPWVTKLWFFVTEGPNAPFSCLSPATRSSFS